MLNGIGYKLYGSRGQSLIEILIAMGLGAAILVSVSALMAVNLRSSSDTKVTQLASSLAQEELGGLRAMAESDWLKIYCLPDGDCSNPGGKGPDNFYYYSTSTAQILIGQENIIADSKNFIRYFYVENVNRDNCGVGAVTLDIESGCVDIQSAGVAEDPSTQKITVIVTLNGRQIIKQSQYVMRSKNVILKQNDWGGGGGQDGAITTVNSMFASSTSINFDSVPGSIFIDGLATTTP